MKIHKIVFVAAAGMLGFAACSDSFPTLSEKVIPRISFTAPLTGAAERPTPVTTTMSGVADIQMIPTHRDSTLKVDTNIVRVTVIGSGMDNLRVTQAHIHAGDANTAGPVMVFLLSNVSAGRAPVAGTDKVITRLDITRTTAFQTGWNFDSLLARIKAGTAYVNVHTTANTGGEIRGQIVAQ